MIGKKVKAGEISGKVVATVDNAVFIEVEENVFKVVHIDEVVEETEPEPAVPADIPPAPVAGSTTAPAPAVNETAPKKKASRKKKPE